MVRISCYTMLVHLRSVGPVEKMSLYDCSRHATPRLSSSDKVERLCLQRLQVTGDRNRVRIDRLRHCRGFPWLKLYLSHNLCWLKEPSHGLFLYGDGCRAKIEHSDGNIGGLLGLNNNVGHKYMVFSNETFGGAQHHVSISSMAEADGARNYIFTSRCQNGCAATLTICTSGWWFGLRRGTFLPKRVISLRP